MEGYESPKGKEMRKVVITGGTEGIGRAITSEMLSQDNDVAICARTKERLDELALQHETIRAYQIDLEDRRAARGFIENAITDLEGLDILILNAAVTGIPHTGETAEETDARKKQVFKVNEVVQVALTRAAADELRKNNGTVVFVTSGLARKSIPGSEDYGKSKKRIEEFLDEFMNRPGNQEIDYFSVSPGAVDTRMHKEIAEHGPFILSGMSKMAKAWGCCLIRTLSARLFQKWRYPI